MRQKAIWFGRQEQEGKQLRLQESTCLIRRTRNILRSVRSHFMVSMVAL